MEYYFNELSIPNEIEAHLIIQQIRNFVMTCRDLKEIQFDTLRADCNIRHIEINEKLLVEWLKDETELRRSLKTFDSKFPYIQEKDIDKDLIEWQIVSYKGQEGMGLKVACLKTSLSVSFPSTHDWKQTEIEVQLEWLPEGFKTILTENIMVKNASLPLHYQTHKLFAIEKLKQDIAPEDWEPNKKHLPRFKMSNKILDVKSFYNNIGTKTIADFLEMGRHVAELNFYEKDEELTAINRSKSRIRHIYESKNISGKKRYLSIDVEKGAFEVCDERGVHIEEMLFNEKRNSGQKLDHSIKLKN